MVDLAPFCGLRFDTSRVGGLDRVTAPPYDAIDAARQARLYDASPYNVVRLELGRDEEGDDREHNRYTRAAEMFAQWRRDGVLRPDPADAVYVYEQRFEHRGARRVQVGLIASLAVTPWEAREVLPHERVFRAPVEDRKRLLAALPVNVSPIFVLTARTPPEVGALLDERRRWGPDAAFRDGDEIRHRLWMVDDGEAHAVVGGALAGETVLMADGHHRYTTALEHHAEHPGPGTGRVMAYVVGADRGPVIAATHRLVTRLPADLLGRLRAAGVRPEPVDHDAPALAKVVEDAAPGTFGLVTADRSFLLRGGPDELDALSRDLPEPIDQLDITRLQRLLLGPLGVPDGIETLRYTSDIAEAATAVGAGRAEGLFVVRPVTFGQFRAVCERGVRMPPKSTTFVPKPRTGLVLRPLGRAIATGR